MEALEKEAELKYQMENQPINWMTLNKMKTSSDSKQT
jgi:hypothetical protein